MYKVEKLALGGEGIALSEGKRIFIPLSAPGDSIEADIIEDHGSWARAECVEILEASPYRVEAPCKHYGECGGCSLQHLSYEAQLSAKKRILGEALGKLGTFGKPGKAVTTELPPITVIPSAPFEYRNRVSLHALRSNRFPRCGFKERKSEKIIPLDDCPVLVPELRAILPHLLPPPGKDRFTLYGKGETLLAETGTRLAEHGITRQLPNRGTITLSGNSSSRGTRNITLEAGSFFQSNVGTLEDLVGRLADIAASKTSGDTAAMADLYAGVGTFSIFLRDFFPGGIDLLESDTAALNLAKRNLHSGDGRGGQTVDGADSGGCRFFPQRDEQWAKKRRLDAYSFVVADPPRQGISPAMLRALNHSGPPVFVYISCEPSTFARDVHILNQSYKPEHLFLFDFYPQTAHIETMGVFSRK